MYDITQREEEYKRNMHEEALRGQSFLLQKTEIQNNNNIASNNTPAYGRVNTQPTVTFNQKLNTDSLYTRQNNLLQMNTGIKKEPAFDLKQAIRNMASQLEARTDDSEEQAKMSSSLMSGQDDSMMPGAGFIDEVIQEAVDVDKAMQYIRDKIREKKKLERQVTQNTNIMWRIGEQKTDGAGCSYKSILQDNKNANEEISYGINWGNAVGNNRGYGINSNLVPMVSRPTNDISFSHNDEMQKNDLQPARSIEEWINRIHSGEGAVTDSYGNNNLNESKIGEEAWQQITTGADAIFGYDPKFDKEIINFILKEYEKEIKFALYVAEGLLEEMPVSVAELAIKLLPPKIKIGGLVVFASIGVYRCAQKAQEKWKRNVNLYKNKHYYSLEVAEDKVSFLEIFFTELMLFFTDKWLENMLRSLGVSEWYIVPLVAIFDATLSAAEIQKWERDYSGSILELSM